MQGDLHLYDYNLPSELIAQEPLEPRSSSRLLDGRGGRIVDRHVSDLPGLLREGDVVVVNDSRVLPARLNLQRPSGGRAEVLLLENLGDGVWEALVNPSSKIPAGTALSDGSEVIVVLEDGFRPGSSSSGTRLLRIVDENALARLGSVPLPPYIKSDLLDPERYQTVFASNPSSAAAPTAGLHFDGSLLTAVEATGARIVRVELAVGLGTFRPIKTESIVDHVMHAERYVVEEAVWEEIAGAERVLAVGTTSMRTLESVALSGELAGRTDIYIRPGFKFRIVDLLMTNFHTPRSSLLVLVSAFYGTAWRELYEHAISSQYRMLSFGDAMLLDLDGGRR